MLPKFKEKQSYLPVQARNTPKKANVSVTTVFMTTMYDKSWQYLQFSAKKYWGIFYVLKNGKKKTNKLKDKPTFFTFYTNTDRTNY